MDTRLVARNWESIESTLVAVTIALWANRYVYVQGPNLLSWIAADASRKSLFTISNIRRSVRDYRQGNSHRGTLPSEPCAERTRHGFLHEQKLVSRWRPRETRRFQLEALTV